MMSRRRLVATEAALFALTLVSCAALRSQPSADTGPASLAVVPPSYYQIEPRPSPRHDRHQPVEAAPLHRTSASDAQAIINDRLDKIDAELKAIRNGLPTPP